MEPAAEDDIQSNASTITQSYLRTRLMSIAGIPDGTELPFVDAPPANITCAQCKSLGPSLWRFPCGHGFCDVCFQRLMPSEISKTICPVDQQSVSRMTVFQDSSIQEMAYPLRSLCPYECGETVRLCALAGHFQFCNRLQEQLASKRCFLRGLGCSFESSQKEELDVHESDMSLHKEMIRSKINEFNHLDGFRNQVNEALVALIEATRNQTELKDRIALLEGRLEEMQVAGRNEQGRASSLPNVHEQTASSRETPSFQFQLGPMSITTYGSEHHLPSLGATSTSRGAQELVCPDGVFQWKLNQYSRAKAKERHSLKKYTSSPSFYAGSPGHHFKIRLHLNGIGSSGRGKYLGVGIVLLKGQFDSQLRYPIHNPITVTLIDQSEKCPEHVEYHLGDPSFVKPKGDYVVPYVWHEFIDMNELESARFLVNDSIILRIKVWPLQDSTNPGTSTLYPSLG